MFDCCDFFVRVIVVICYTHIYKLHSKYVTLNVLTCVLYVCT